MRLPEGLSRLRGDPSAALSSYMSSESRLPTCFDRGEGRVVAQTDIINGIICLASLYALELSESPTVYLEHVEEAIEINALQFITREHARLLHGLFHGLMKLTLGNLCAQSLRTMFFQTVTGQP